MPESTPCTSTPAIPTTSTPTTGRIGLSSLLRDWREQLSWGRFCSLVALVVAVAREFSGADLGHTKLWLGVATGSYGASKLAEVLCSLRSRKSGSAASAEANAASKAAPSSPVGRG